jgi:hypothetical protein
VLSWLKSFAESKRNVASVLALLPLLYQVYQLIQKGEPIPTELTAAIVAIFSSWQIGESIRPSMPKAAE